MATQCPRPEQLSAYASGQISESTANHVAAHVDGCERCQSHLDTLLRKSDSLLQPLRQRANVSEGNAPLVIEKLVAKATQFRPSARESSKSAIVGRETFVRVLRKSGLMRAGEIDEALASIGAGTAQEIALELVRRKKLTRYQAGILARGKSKGLVLGNYVLLEKVGQGGMGMVFKARHNRMDRIVALKILPPSATKSAEAVERFRREVQMAGRLHHENIVVAHDADEAAGVYFLVMEYVEGSDLSALVKKHGPLPVSQAINCVLQAARGLQYAHEQGIIHRDIKPNNLLLDTGGTIKILDMGLARIDSALHGGEGDLTGTGTVMGTVDYMSPEQALNAKHADHRSDIYSLGCTLFFLLTGHSMFRGETIMERLVAHRESSIPSLRAVRKSVDESLDVVFQRMVAKRPEQRYSSMDEIVTDLQALVSGNPVELPALPRFDAAVDLQRLGEPSSDGADFLQTVSQTTLGPAHDTAANPTQVWSMPTVTPPARTVKRKLLADKRIIFGSLIAAGIVLLAVIGGVILGLTSEADKELSDSDLSADIAQSRIQDDDGARIQTPGDSGGSNSLNVTGSVGKVLLVVAHEGYWYPDFEGVANALKSRGFGVVVASSQKGVAKSNRAGVPQLIVRTTLDEAIPREFDAVIFCGGNVEEFKSGYAKKSAQRIIYEMNKHGKLICSICTGDEVLDAAGILHDVDVAKCDDSMLTNCKVKLSGDATPVWCGNIVTAGHAEQSQPFVDTIAEAIKKKRK